MTRVPKPYIHPRDKWGARESKCVDLYPGKLKELYYRITVHHTVEFNPDTIEALQSIQRIHMDRNGWADIGYHYIIDQKGNIWGGRNIAFPGAHVAQNNWGNLGIACLLNAEVMSPSVEMKASLGKLIKWLCRSLVIDPWQIKGHRDYLATACPGRLLYPYLEQVRAGLK